MSQKEKYIGNTKLTEQPKKALQFKLKPNSITTDKIVNEAVTEEKLSVDVQDKINYAARLFSLGFYNDDDPPTPLLMLAIRPGFVSKTIKPYLLQNQKDVSRIATEWKWERESDYPDADAVWNASDKAHQRVLHLTDADFPSGWEYSNKLNFRCSVTFEYGTEQLSLINITTII